MRTTMRMTPPHNQALMFAVAKSTLTVRPVAAERRTSKRAFVVVPAFPSSTAGLSSMDSEGTVLLFGIPSASRVEGFFKSTVKVSSGSVTASSRIGTAKDLLVSPLLKFNVPVVAV